MKNVLKNVAVLTAFLLAVCGLAGCTPKETGPQFETAYVIDEYAKLAATTQCLVDGDPVAGDVIRVEIKACDVRSTDSVYEDVVSDHGLGLPAFSNLDGSCVVFTVDKTPVIRITDWEKTYYVIPAQSEEDARDVLEAFMRAYAESMGIS